MNILILGGDGFIGSYLLQHHLYRRHNVAIVDINNIRTNTSSEKYTYIHRDLSNNTQEQVNQIIKEFEPDFVYNCIAIANPDFYVKFPIKTYDLDFTVNYEIIKQLINAKIPFIHFSTSEVYGKDWTNIHQEDTSNLILGPTHKSRWIYATSKILLEQLIFAHNTDAVIIRPQNFCGWNMDWLPHLETNKNLKWKPRLPACILNSLITNTPLNVVLPGTQKRCYTDIRDAITGISSIIDNWDKCNKQVFNIGNKHNETTIQYFVELMRDTWNLKTSNKYKHTAGIVQVDAKDFYGPGYEDCDRRLFSDKKLYDATGWKPEINLQQLVDFFIEQSIINYKL